jgi:hypothetical protein
MKGPKHDFEPEELAMSEALAWAKRQPTCPTAARIQAYAARALPDDQIEQLARHFGTCSSCRLLAEDFARLERPEPDDASIEKLWQRLRPSSSGAQSKPVIERRRISWAWLMAPVAAAALIVFAVRAPGPRPPGPIAAARPHAPPAPAYDLKRIAPVEPAPIVLPMENLLTWRGAESIGAKRDKRDATSAFVAYQKGDYIEAARQFGSLAASDPRDYQAAFYCGVAQLLSDHPAEAVATLERAKSLGGAAERIEAQWYLGLALVRAGQLTEGRGQLEPLCSGGAGHAQDACLVLRRLASPAAAPSRP